MKRFFLIVALVGSALFSTAYAANPKTAPAVVRSFKNAFHGATEVSWQQTGDFYKVTFALDGQYSSAFFNSDGDLVAVTKNMSSVQLPKALRASLKQQLQGRWITDLFVVSAEGENTYYVTVENADTSVVLKSAGTKRWTVYQTTEK